MPLTSRMYFVGQPKFIVGWHNSVRVEHNSQLVALRDPAAGRGPAEPAQQRRRIQSAVQNIQVTTCTVWTSS